MQQIKGDNIGIMDAAFFVSKSILLNWVNDHLKVKQHKLNSLIALNHKSWAMCYWSCLLLNYWLNLPGYSQDEHDQLASKVWLWVRTKLQGSAGCMQEEPD